MISVEHPNGYKGVLAGNGMTIYRNGREVIHATFPAPKTYDELYECLETMPEFMDVISDDTVDTVLADDCLWK